MTFVATVEDNFKNYAVCNIEKTKVVRKLQGIIGYPLTKDFINLVKKNLLPNCPVNVDGIKAAKDIFGPNLANLKGKTTQQNAEPVDTSTVGTNP